MPNTLGNDIESFIMSSEEYEKLNTMNGDFDFDEMMSLEPSEPYKILCSDGQIVSNL